MFQGTFPSRTWIWWALGGVTLMGTVAGALIWRRRESHLGNWREEPWLQPWEKEREWLAEVVAVARPKSCSLKLMGKVPGRPHMLHYRRNGDYVAIGRGGHGATQAFAADPKGNVVDWSAVAETGGTDESAVEWVVESLCRR